MTPDFIRIAIDTDEGVAVMMFVTQEYLRPAFTSSEVSEKLALILEQWDKAGLKYDQRDKDALTVQLQTSHYGRTVEPTDENIQKEMTKAGIVWNSYKVIKSLPDRTFRKAWILGKDGIEEDAGKCREIFLERLRIEREQYFTDNDKEYLIAQQKKEDTADIEAKAQYLRDLPDVTTDEIKELTPDELKSYEIKWQSQK